MVSATGRIGIVLAGGFDRASVNFRRPTCGKHSRSASQALKSVILYTCSCGDVCNSVVAKDCITFPVGMALGV